jgi:hypothetical protein
LAGARGMSDRVSTDVVNFQMTLQYRIRSKYEDQLWTHRVSLCDAVLATAVSDWCVAGGDFPAAEVVAVVLRVFSSRCFAGELRPSGIWGRLRATVGTAEAEYRSAWPRRGESEAAGLIGSLTAIVASAVRVWADDGLGALGFSDVTERLVAEILAGRYVIVHHSESTLRDANHWGI